MSHEGGWQHAIPTAHRTIVLPGGKEIARGLSAYSSIDAERLRGRQSSEIETLLGFHGRDEIIHRDDLVITG